MEMSTIWVAILAGLTGATAGSFLYTVVRRSKQNKSWVRGRSKCDKCQKILGARELIPIFSFLFLRGHCRRCRKKISAHHFTAELSLASLFALAVLFPVEVGSQHVLWTLAIFIVLFLLWLFDVYIGVVPDIISGPAIIGIVTYHVVNGADILGLVCAALVGGAVFLLQYLISRGRWVGAGDIRLGVLAGIIVGWPHIVTVLFIAYVGGAIVALVLLATKRIALKDRVPMGAFLLPAILLVMWFGETFLKLIAYN